MDEKFWHKRWETNDIGFHKAEAHHDLVKFFERLQLRPGDTVFVPLCGKSPDLVWLREQGLQVVGVELSRTAVDAFFAENSLCGEWTSAAGMTCCCAEGYTIYCGDLFELTPAHLLGSRVLYDRGALVALPSDMRSRYAQHVSDLMPKAGRMLTISYEYDQNETAGPPFSVSREEIASLFGSVFEIELLIEEDTLWSHQGLAARGVTQLTEFASLLTKS